ncbi:nuclear transport factor 2 family protein [Uniformispora flossi]|uniref:nuclear transport factor 2 family protein n=1 Tax=Uniformispora flossi TaxID=3390723 RepID=UPI003C2ED10C
MNHTTDNLVRAGFDAWNELDADRRDAALEALFAPDARIIDPNWTATGREEILAAVGQVRNKLGDMFLALTKVVGANLGTALLTWEPTPLAAGAAPVATSYGTVVAEGGQVVQAGNSCG